MSEPAIYGRDLFGDAITPPDRCKLADDFTAPPFSVLNAREGWWQERKAAWLAHGIKSEIGRGGNALGREAECANHYRNAARAEVFGTGGPGTMDAQRKAWRGETASLKGGLVLGTAADPVRVRGETSSLKGGLTHGTTIHQTDGSSSRAGQSGTSIFDPVLCELVYRWFAPPGGTVLDPFAGGSVRGIVAGMLGRSYHGIELRPEQVAANREQAAAIAPAVAPEWACGDARDLLPAAPPADFVFSCPPYFDLERYSDDARDLSAMDWPAFLAAYRAIIAASAARLRPDRFACFVIGDVRDKNGMYRNLPGETAAAFAAAGMPLYNDAVLVTMIGSLPIRVGAQFSASRKMGKAHQNVMVFVKGDPRKATARIAAPGQEAA